MKPKVTAHDRTESLRKGITAFINGKRTKLALTLFTPQTAKQDFKSFGFLLASKDDMLWLFLSTIKVINNNHTTTPITYEEMTSEQLKDKWSDIGAIEKFTINAEEAVKVFSTFMTRNVIKTDKPAISYNAQFIGTKIKTNKLNQGTSFDDLFLLLGYLGIKSNENPEDYIVNVYSPRIPSNFKRIA